MKVMDCRYRPTTAAWMDSFVKSPVYADYVKITGFDKKPVKELSDCAAQLEELGVMLGCTNERVRQIQNQALSKLRDLLVDEAGFANE